MGGEDDRPFAAYKALILRSHGAGQADGILLLDAQRIAVGGRLGDACAQNQ